MASETTDPKLTKKARALYILATVNAGIWAIAMIALVVLLENKGNTRGLFPILAGGMAVAIALISSASNIES